MSKLKATLLTSISALPLVGVALIVVPQQARAANECGPAVAGVVICSGPSYPTGIAYSTTGTPNFDLTLDNPAMNAGPVNASGSNPGTITVNAQNFGTIAGGAASGITVSNAGTGSASVVVGPGSITSNSSYGIETRSLNGAPVTVTLNGGSVETTNGGIGSYAIFAFTNGASTITMNGGSVTAARTGLYASTATFMGPGAPTIQIKGGTITAATNGAETTSGTSNSTIIMTGGSVSSLNASGRGLSATTGGTATASVTMSGGTVSAAGNNADGIYAQANGTGKVNVTVSGGTVTGGAGTGAALRIQGSLAGGSIVSIGAGAEITAGASGIAIRDTGGGAAITTAGTLTGAIQLGAGTDAVTVTGGSIAGNIIGDGVDSLTFTLGSGRFDYGAPYDITGMASVAMNSGTATIGGTISTSALNVNGGKLILNDSSNTATTGTTVTGGMLAVGGAGSTGAQLTTPTLDVLAGGGLQGIGTIIGDVNNAGLIAPGNSIGILTIAGDYAGVGGTLEIEAILGGDASPTDLLHVTGNTSGSTNVGVINLGGSGAPTVEGIRIVQVDGVSAGTFSLLGDYVYQGDQAVVGGAYAYRLYQGGTSTPGDGDWYLRSDLIAGDPSSGALLQPGAPLYESHANVLLSLNQPRTMQQRVGNRSWGPGVIETGTNDGLVEDHGIWGQIEASRGSFDSATSTTNANYDLNLWKLHAGMDGVLSQHEGGTLVGGIAVGFGTVAASVSSPVGAGTINAQGYSLGGALTWYGTDGFYVDGQAQVSAYRSDIFSSTAGLALVQGSGALGYGLSIEAGQQIDLGSNWSVTPQVQLAHSAVASSFTDAFGAPVALEQGDSLVGRLGLSVDYQAEEGDTRSHLYGIANVYYDFAGNTVTDLAGVDLTQAHDPLRGGIGVGGSYNWDHDKYSIFGEASVVTSLTKPADGYALNGQAGLRIRW